MGVQTQGIIQPLNNQPEPKNMAFSRCLISGILLCSLSIASAQTQTLPATTTSLFLLTGTKSPEQLPTATILSVDGTKTTYDHVHCTGIVNSRGDFEDPCPFVGGLVTAEPTQWEYQISKLAVQFIASDGPQHSDDLFTYVTPSRHHPHGTTYVPRYYPRRYVARLSDYL